MIAHIITCRHNSMHTVAKLTIFFANNVNIAHACIPSRVFMMHVNYPIMGNNLILWRPLKLNLPRATNVLRSAL